MSRQVVSNEKGETANCVRQSFDFVELFLDNPTVQQNDRALATWMSLFNIEPAVLPSLNSYMT